MTSVFLEKFKRDSFLLVLLFISTLFYSCLGSIGNIDEAEDSGFRIDIRNYSDIPYTGCAFYVGAIDKNDNFIALDSLVYPDLHIKSRSEDTKIDGFNREYSLTEPFLKNSKGLTKFNTWAPPSKDKIDNISLKGEITFKFNLYDGKSGLSTPLNFSNGNIEVFILKDGKVEW